MTGPWVDRYKHWVLPIWALLVLAYFRYKTPYLWQADWSHDDLMNCYRAMTTTWRDHIEALVMFWKPTPLFRPLGEIYYKLMWEWFGFSAMPWRLSIAGLLVLNAFIVGHIAMRLTGNQMAGLVATVVAVYHPLWLHLYINTGTIFEIAAFTLVYAGFASYIEFRNPLLPCIFLVLGLNTKESAVVLPVLVVLYEWIWHKRMPWVFCGLAGGICAAFIFGRVLSPSGIAAIGDYRPQYDLATYLARFRGYFGALWLVKQMPLWLAVVLSLAPLALRNRMSAFAVMLFPLAILPLGFVLDRGLEGVYIACASQAFVVAAVWMKLRSDEQRLSAVLGLMGLLLLLLPGIWGLPGWDRDLVEIREVRTAMQRELPSVPRYGRVRFVSEPFREDEYPWATTFITRLLYRNPDLAVVRGGEIQNDDLAVFAWREGKLYRIK